MKLTLADLEKMPHRELRHREKFLRTAFRGVSTDSRTTQPGDLFFALRGERFDGHAYLGAAFAAGAAAAVVAHDAKETRGQGTEQEPLVVVDDTLDALGLLARAYRQKFRIPVLAVGGSNGKTTTKEMISRVLEEKYSVLSTAGNLNNRIGVPLTLFRLRPGHEVAVIELGTNHPGEIAALCRLLAPTHALITCIGREHLEYFTSLDGVEAEEGELFRALAGRRRNLALVNADDPRVRRASRCAVRKLTYGFLARTPSVRGRKIELDDGGRASFEFRSSRMTRWQRVALALPGTHNALNALAAAAAGIAFHVPPAGISRALATCRPPGGRMAVSIIGGVTLLDDTYNANPDSAVAALRTLASLRVRGKRIAVLGDMKELGAHSAEGHAEVGTEAAALGIEYILTFGNLARQIHDAAGTRGAMHYDQKNMLAEYLAELLAPGDAVLVKGSRGMHMEDIVTFLRDRRENMARIAGAAR